MKSVFKLFKKKGSSRKGHSFYVRENLIQTIDELNLIMQNLDTEDAIETSSKIVFQNKELDSINFKNLVYDFGKESYILEPKTYLEGHKIYFYRVTSGHLKFLMQIHFINEDFFFAGTKVYAESYLSKNDLYKVTHRIIEKYCPSIDKSIIDFKIKDTIGNVMFTHQDIYYYIKYLANNGTSKKLKNQYSGYRRSTGGEEIKETLDSLI